MTIGKHIYVLLALMLALAGCQSVNPEDSEAVLGKGVRHELVLNQRLSLPAPEVYGKISPDEDLVIFSGRGNSVGYRWIDKEEVEFIGSNKSPYHFFNGAFNKPSTEEENRFLEGFGKIVDRSFVSTNNLEFYLFDLGGRQKIYILSGSLDFVTEITSSGDLKNIFKVSTQYSYIQ